MVGSPAFSPSNSFSLRASTACQRSLSLKIPLRALKNIGMEVKIVPARETPA